MSKIVISTSSFDTDNNPHIQDLTKKGLGIASNSYGRKLTEDEVIALLGKPAGRAMYPAAKEPGGTLISYEVYLYDKAKTTGPNKNLLIYLSPAKVVTDYELSVKIY